MMIDADLDVMLDRAMSFGSLYQIKMPRWTEDEDRFLRDNFLTMTDAEIGAALGRSEIAVHLRWERDLDLPARSKQPGYVTGNRAAAILGIDVHSVMRLAAKGILPCGRAAGVKGIFVIGIRALYRWAVNPLHWPYFQPWKGKVTDPHLQRLITRQAARWGDEWLTPGQAAAVYGQGITSNDINRYLHAGKLAGVQWGNWWVRRSDVTGLVFYKGSGAAKVAAAAAWPVRADAFILAARAAGKTYAEIGRMMGWPKKRVAYRVLLLKGRGVNEG